MGKRTDYSKVSYKAKSPKSIRYNIMDFEAACEISGRTTVQSLWDYLLAKYLAENGKYLVAPIDMIDSRPIDPKIYEVSKDQKITPEKVLLETKPKKEILPQQAAAQPPKQSSTLSFMERRRLQKIGS